MNISSPEEEAIRQRWASEDAVWETRRDEGGSVDAVEAELRRLCDEGKMTVNHADEAASRLFSAAHGI